MEGLNDKQKSSSENEQLVEREPISGTPFDVVKGTNGWFVAMGRYVISEQHETKAIATKDAKKIDWNKVCAVINVTIANYDEFRKTND